MDKIFISLFLFYDTSGVKFMTTTKRIYTAFLKLAVSIIFIFLAMKALGFGGFSSSIIAGVLFLIGVFHHVFWPTNEYYEIGEIE